MEIIVFLSIVIAVLAVLTSFFLILRVKKQIAEMTDALIDVKNGNGNRRILSATNELVAPIAYEINEIVVSYESRLSIVRQTEETNRQLMTSLSHDVRTPLTTLIGYLDAAHKQDCIFIPPAGRRKDDGCDGTGIPDRERPYKVQGFRYRRDKRRPDQSSGRY